MKKQDLIDLVNTDCLYSLYDVEDILPECVQCVATDLEIDRHRWHSTCVNQLYSDMMTFSDCDCHCEASEYEEVPTITYKPKNRSMDIDYINEYAKKKFGLSAEHDAFMEGVRSGFQLASNRYLDYLSEFEKRRTNSIIVIKNNESK